MKIHKLTIKKDWLSSTVSVAIYKDHLVVINKMATREDEVYLDKELAKEFADADTVVSTSAKGLVFDFNGKIYDLPDETEDDKTDEDADDDANNEDNGGAE